jgi:hypothetical protein
MMDDLFDDLGFCAKRIKMHASASGSKIPKNPSMVKADELVS